ncbi:MAG TPA: DegT/DnrJ/EryC1/StrS family aminotransferase [Acidimicrobiales bacterium]|nr:DegT/DnrJ/EryC1/StrS family aminotransferase [Acidimicrobiales bacterium]
MIRLSAPSVGEEEIEAVTAVLRSGQLAQGPEVAAFEAAFAHLVDGRPCVAVNAGTSGLQLALMALGIGPGDEVVVPSFTFAGTANAVRLAGAEPVFADIEGETFGLDPEAVAAAITPRTAAVMPVHLYGHPARMAELTEVARRHQVALVEDAAQAHGASLAGRPVGAFGDAAVFSFYATKNMTTGEGGMVVLTDEAALRRLKLLRNQGMERQYENEIVGFNMRMTDVAAAIGRVQLGRLDERNARRRANATVLDEALGDVVITPAVAPGAVHVYHQYTVRTPRRDELQAGLAELGVEARVFYPVPVDLLTPYRGSAARAAGVLTETDRAAGEVLSLPVGPHLSDEDVSRVAEGVLKVLAG